MLLRAAAEILADKRREGRLAGCKCPKIGDSGFAGVGTLDLMGVAQAIARKRQPITNSVSWEKKMNFWLETVGGKGSWPRLTVVTFGN